MTFAVVVDYFPVGILAGAGWPGVATPFAGPGRLLGGVASRASAASPIASTYP